MCGLALQKYMLECFNFFTISTIKIRFYIHLKALVAACGYTHEQLILELHQLHVLRNCKNMSQNFIPLDNNIWIKRFVPCHKGGKLVWAAVSDHFLTNIPALWNMTSQRITQISNITVKIDNWEILAWNLTTSMVF